jgi:hypothetical protein
MKQELEQVKKMRVLDNFCKIQTKTTEAVYGSAFADERFWLRIDEDPWDSVIRMTYSIMDSSPKFGPVRDVLEVRVEQCGGFNSPVFFPLFDAHYGLNDETLKAFLLCVEDAKERATLL